MEDKNNETENGANEYYIVCVHGAIHQGPHINAPEEELNKFFEGVKKYNKEQGKEVVTFYHPTKDTETLG